jgi:predicted ATPase/DNA-binding CsgD family transcriptional regulator/DNA-binding XRE family transcriptional regulator
MATEPPAAFGDLLRHARRDAGLTQEELAERAGLSTRAISDLERGINRAPRRDTLEMLAEALELPATDRAHWEQARQQLAVRSASVARSGTHQPNIHLPTPLTNFIGRGQEINEAASLLRLPGVRLLTLTGTGGVGKTRLSLMVARAVADGYPDGVWFVPLAPVREPAFVASTIASKLGVRELGGQPLIESLRAWLRARQALLVIDNFEHVLDAAPLIADLLTACPSAKVLVTSRSRLRLSGEHDVLIRPLALPAEDKLSDAGSLLGNPSVSLFVERAREVSPDFSLTDGNAATVAAICRQLDGLPLAIELAAAWIRILTPRMLLHRLEERLPLLTGGPRDMPDRQRTLRNTIAWSYDLLGASEQALFRRQSIFNGGWTLESAESVMASTAGFLQHDSVLDSLTALADQHLILQVEQGDGSLRFGMLETIREYGLEQVQANTEMDDACQRHAEYFLTLAEQAERELTGPNQINWLGRLESEHNNLRAALSWSSSNDPDMGLRLAASLWLFWYTHGHLREGREWLDQMLSAATGSDPRTQAKALNGAGWIALFQMDYAPANEMLNRGLSLYRELGDADGIVSCLANLGFVVMLGEQDPSSIPAILDEALRLRPAVSDKRTVANLLVLAGLVSLAQGDMDQAVSLHEESLALYESSRDIQGMTMCLVNLSLMALGRRDYARAELQLREVLQYSEISDDKNALLNALNGLAAIASSRQQWVRAAQLWGAAEALSETTGLRIAPITYTITHLDEHLHTLHTHLEDAALARAWAEGKSMTQDEAIDCGFSDMEVCPSSGAPESIADGPLEGLPPGAEASPAEAVHDLFTRREVEILRLVTTGMSNKEIADDLFISPHTVANHVASIMNKLGLESRTAVATWALRHGLI